MPSNVRLSRVLDQPSGQIVTLCKKKGLDVTNCYSVLLQRKDLTGNDPYSLHLETDFDDCAQGVLAMLRNFMNLGVEEFEQLGDVLLAAVAVSIPLVTLMLFLVN